jgi:hypothetical protein
LTHVKGIDWQQLSNIGQTYGAASAILSGVALIGVVFSLLVQARQAKSERIRVVRERHMEILQLVMSDPKVYGPVTGMLVDSQADADRVRASLLATMWMNYGRMGYQMDILSERSLRAEFFPNMFRSGLTRNWWTTYRELWLSAPVPDRRGRKFTEIAEEEYRKAVAAGPPTVLVNTVQPDTRLSGRWRGLAAVASGIMIGMLIKSRIVGNRRTQD